MMRFALLINLTAQCPHISPEMISSMHLVFSMVGEVCRVMEKDAERHDKIYGGLQFIKREMEIVDALLKDQEYQEAVQEIRIQQLQEFAYDVEDFVEGLWEPGAYGKVLVALGMDPRPQQLRRIEQFKETILYLTKDWKQSPESSRGDNTDQGEPEQQEEELQGIDGPKREILELLSLSTGERQQLRVVSIVGCRGVGKTSLARSVYKDCSASDAFDCVAWVMASGCNNKKALGDRIHESVQAALASKPEKESVRMEDEGALTFSINLQDILSNNRCLVFVDDVQQAHPWKHTVDACKKDGSKSTIVVTTSVRSVATACSSGSYVYSMKCLNDADSKCLFWRKVYGNQMKPPYSMVTASERIFRKCGGLPLALICVAKHLNLKGNDLQSGHCEEVNLGRYCLLGNNNAVTVFKEIRRVLMQCYDNLPDYDHRSLLLYLSIFPRGHQIKGNNLLRRLLAEGLIVNQHCKCFDELIDRCIVEPVQILNNSAVIKSCQVHDPMMDYIIHKSVDKNVATLIQGSEPLLIARTGACVRRLSIQSSNKERFEELDGKSASLRSLSLFNSEPVDLQSCKMLRLLDLEGCPGLDKRFLEGLCELLLLRYLNLRKTSTNKLPTQIEKLQRLETLDIRDTKVEKLPMEVIMLPKLAYLFGKFQLPDVPNGKVTNTLTDFLKKKSVLHTLSGFVANKRQGPEHVILLARNLKKVKVWCKDSPTNTGWIFPVSKHGSSSSQRKRMLCGKAKERNPRCKNTEEGSLNDNFDLIRLLKIRVTPLESVSVVSSGLGKDFLASLEGPKTISSIKLRGNLDSLPDSTKLSELGGIKKLQLFSTGLTIKDLSALQYLRGLEYLMLHENCDTFCNSIFIVEENGFESLKSLCIVAPMVPKLRFKEGAMESLTSLHLLCPNSQMQLPSGTVEGISHLTKLSEVVLHSSMQQVWETIADGHPKRPCVKRQQQPIPHTAA